MNVTETMKSSGVVAAVKDEKGFRNALSSRASVVFLLKSELLTVGETVERAHAAGKKILVHVDLTEGIGKDEAAIRYIAERVKPDGVITTRPNIVKCAKACGLYTVFRVFLIDTQGLDSALSNADKLRPDAVELMPGLIPSLVGRFLAPSRAVIAGGLITTREQATAAIKAGAVAASTSDPELW